MERSFFCKELHYQSREDEKEMRFSNPGLTKLMRCTVGQLEGKVCQKLVFDYPPPPIFFLGGGGGVVDERKHVSAHSSIYIF